MGERKVERETVVVLQWTQSRFRDVDGRKRVVMSVSERDWKFHPSLSLTRKGKQDVDTKNYDCPSPPKNSLLSQIKYILSITRRQLPSEPRLSWLCCTRACLFCFLVLFLFLDHSQTSTVNRTFFKLTEKTHAHRKRQQTFNFESQGRTGKGSASFVIFGSGRPLADCPSLLQADN